MYECVSACVRVCVRVCVSKQKMKEAKRKKERRKTEWSPCVFSVVLLLGIPSFLEFMHICPALKL